MIELNVTRPTVGSWRWHFAPAVMSALLLALCYPRIGWGWLAHVALAPVAIMALKSARPRRLIVSTFIVSLVWWLVMIEWLRLVTFGGWIVLSAVMALSWPLTWVCYRLLVGGRWMPSVLALPLAWVSFEFIRVHVPAGGFAWFELGHSQAPYLPGRSAGYLVQSADLFGEHTVSFIVAATNGLVVDLLTRPLVCSGGSRRPMWALPAVWAVIFFGAWGYGRYRVATTSPTEGTIDVAVVQTNVPQDNKINPTPESMERNWKRMVELIRIAAQDKPQLIVCPETMVPAALNREAIDYYTTARTGERGMEKCYHQLRAMAAELDTALLMGAHAKYQWTEVDAPTPGNPGMKFILPKRRYNAAFLILPSASRAVDHYAKIHRVPFGEYVPWVDSSPALKRLFIRTMTPYDFDYSLSAGREHTVFKVGDVSLATPICIEDAIARLARRMVYGKDGRKRIDLMINLTNDGWYPGSAQGLQHVQLATLRCVENRVPMARSVNTGISGFIDSTGQVVAQVMDSSGRSQQIEGVASATLSLDPRKTLFGRWGEWPVGLMTLATILAAAGTVVRARSRRGRR